MNDAVLVLSTAGSLDEGERLAKALVEEHLAACVNIVPGVRSCYRWQGKIESADEVLLLIKTTPERYDALELRLRALHSYEVPELVRISIDGGEAGYLAWLRSQVER